MEKDKGPIDWLKKLLTKETSEKKTGKYQYLMIVLLFGAAIMIVSNLIFQKGQSTEDLAVFKNEKEEQTEDVPTFGMKNTKQKDLISTYEEAYENQLKEALEGIKGVSDVTVVVNVDATEQQILEKNSNTQTQTTEESDKEGGKRKVEDSSKEEQLVIIRNGEEEVPIVVETKKPKIRGVLIVAKGAGNIQVKKWIIEAVTRVLDVPSHRVAVMPKKDYRGEDKCY
jgi:stage III sporulation protein AG